MAGGVFAAEPSSVYRLATFSADVTVPMGHGMMGGAWLSKSVADPLEAHGLALLGAGKPVVFVALDWCEIRNEALDRWQQVLAEAAGTERERVLVCAVHQHDAPVADLGAERILRERKAQGTVCDPEFHEKAVQRVANALRETLPSARRVTHLGLGAAQVERIASNRRYLASDGSVRFDRTSSTRNPLAQNAPENLIDPWLKTLSFWDGDTPVAAVSAYAVHPMSYYGQGEVSADFPGRARRRRQQETPGVKQIYLTGCAGNVTAGKYNTGDPTNRAALAERLHQAMVKAWAATRRVPLTQADFRVERVRLEPRDEPGFTVKDLEQKLATETRPFQQCLAAMGLSWRRRADAGQRIEIPCVDFGAAQWLVLPGESYVEFQLAAQRMRPDRFVLVAGYGEGATGYIPTERHIAERDGNLSDWSWVAPGSEARLLEGIRRVLRAPEARSSAPQRLRYLIETDAGGDPDDEQSLVRFLLYANEWDIEGIIANRPAARDRENLNSERTGLGIVRRMIAAYGQCYSNLVQHDARYPTPAALLQRTVSGAEDSDAGVNLILAAVDRDDPRPVWFSNWGTDRGSAPSCLKRALDRVRRERGPSGYAKFKDKLRLTGDNPFGEHTSNAPPWRLWVDTLRPELNRQRWYHRFSSLTARAGGFDIERDVRTGHGPLGALYPTNTTHPQKEGDTMMFLYLVPTGLNDPNEPTWGSWAGRYGLRDDAAGRPYYWANQSDAWEGTLHRENSLKRWAAHLQNDFKARLDWCVQPSTAANHPPRIVLNGVDGTEVLHCEAEASADLKLDAGASSDPDGHRLHYEWFVYREPGSYRGHVSIVGSNAAAATLQVPGDAAGHTIHAVVTVTDAGEPPLTRYRRAVISVSDAHTAQALLAPHFQPPAEYVGQLGSHRSPLLFPNGTKVQSPADWTRRRAEISQQWMELMGPWPPVLEKPKVEILSEIRRDNFTQQRVRIEIAPNQTGEGWLLVPDAAHPLPAVLVVYYEPETSIGLGKEPLRDFGLQLARRGFVTLSIGTPGGNAWKPDTGAAVCQPLSFHAYVAANGWHALANLPQVDRARIGVVGHSYGGKWALFAAALWEPFACVAVSDPGIVFDETRSNVNYWEPWYLGLDPQQKRPKAGVPSAENPRTGAYRRMIETGRDLHELHALIAPRPFLVSGGSEDPPERWRVLNHTVAVNQVLGQTNRVAMTNRPAHAPTEESNRQLYVFFEHFLKYNRPTATSSR